MVFKSMMYDAAEVGTDVPQTRSEEVAYFALCCIFMCCAKKEK